MTQVITREAIPFFMPVRYHSKLENKSVGQSLVELVDGFFSICSDQQALVMMGQEFRDTKTNVILSETVKTFNKDSSSCVITALKVLAYITVVIPLLALIAKAILRSIYSFEEIVKSEGSESDQEDTAVSSAEASAAYAIADAAAKFQRDFVYADFKRFERNSEAIEVLHKFKDLTGDDSFNPDQYADEEAYLIIAAQVEGLSVGFVILDLMGDVTSTNVAINYCVIDPKFRGKTLGASLLSEAVNAAHELEKEMICFGVRNDLPTTQKQLEYIRNFCRYVRFEERLEEFGSGGPKGKESQHYWNIPVRGLFPS